MRAPQRQTDLELLGLTESELRELSPEDRANKIKRQYKLSMLRWHPDKLPGSNTDPLADRIPPFRPSENRVNERVLTFSSPHFFPNRV